MLLLWLYNLHSEERNVPLSFWVLGIEPRASHVLNTCNMSNYSDSKGCQVAEGYSSMGWSGFTGSILGPREIHA
jgi:hypothetical protein